MMTCRVRVNIKKALKEQASADELLNHNDLLVRRLVSAENLREAKNATKLYQQYKKSPEQYRMTFSEYKRRHRSS